MENYELLVKKMKEQEMKIIKLEEQVGTLNEHIRLLSICKETDSSYSYYNFLVDTRISATQRSNIDLFFLILSEIIKGRELTDRHMKVIEKLQIQSVVATKKVLYREVEKYIMEILNCNDEVVLEMLNHMSEQGVNNTVCNYLLSQVKYKDTLE